MKMDENKKLEEFVLKFECILCQLKMSSAEIRDENTMHITFCLTKLYETVVTFFLENLPAENVNLDFVKARLRTEAEKRKETGMGQDERKSIYLLFMSNKTMAWCGEYGHLKRNCRKSFQDQPNSAGNRNNLNQEDAA